MGFINDIISTSLEYGLIWCLLGLGVYISFKVLDFADLSIESTFPLGAMIAAVLIYFKIDPVLSTICAMLGGMVAGAITGLLHTKLKIPAIISGIVTMSGFYSVILSLGGLTKPNSSTSNSVPIDHQSNIFYKFNTFLRELLIEKLHFDFLSPANVNKISTILIVLVFVIIVFAFVYWFFGTEIGMSLRATGGSPKMARAQGINTSLMIIIGLALSNGFIALSGALFAQTTGVSDINLGHGAIVVGLAAIIIGEMIIGKRKKTFKKTLIGVVLGTVIYYVIYALGVKLRVEHYLKLVTALIVVAVLAFPMFKSYVSRKLKERRNKNA